MSGSIPWQVLQSQYSSYGEECQQELKSLLISPEKRSDQDKEFFDAGRTFAQSFINFNLFSGDLDMSLSSYLEKIFPATLASRLAESIPDLSSSNGKGSSQNVNNHSVDTFNFMRGIMDECTHLGNFSQPIDPSLAIIINAKHDGYVPSQGVIPLTKIWPGSEVRYLDRGHVSAIMFDMDEFRRAIADSLHLNAVKHYGVENLFGGKMLEEELTNRFRETDSN